jgi:hypothetical protein
MAEYAYPMDSKVTYNGNGIPSFDRAVTSAQLRGMISEIITNGVLMANNSNALRVIANGDKSVTIQPGLCVINGAIKKFTEAKTMQLPVSADTNYRCIAICALFDLTNRDIRLVYYNTYPAESATDLVPLNGKDGIDRTDTRYAIQLANIYTAPGSTRIVQSDITDTRLDTERCGAVSSISQFDTTNLYNQIQSDLASFKSTEQAEFQEWFENLQTVLDSNVAAHLQNEIDGLNSSKANKSDITNIIITGTTNNTGSNILAGTLFYLNGKLCKTLVDVANGATFTENTNYQNGILKSSKLQIHKLFSFTSSTEYKRVGSITIPAFYSFGLTAQSAYNDVAPDGVFFSDLNRLDSHGISAEGKRLTSMSGCFSESTTLYIYCKETGTGAATNCSLFGWMEPLY